MRILLIAGNAWGTESSSPSLIILARKQYLWWWHLVQIVFVMKAEAMIIIIIKNQILKGCRLYFIHRQAHIKCNKGQQKYSQGSLTSSVNSQTVGLLIINVLLWHTQSFFFFITISLIAMPFKSLTRFSTTLMEIWKYIFHRRLSYAAVISVKASV